jgi:hypothetical protein
MQKKLLIMTFIFSFVSAHAQNKTIENKIIDTIFKLKEVKERARYVEKESKGKRHLGIAIYTAPSKHEPYYWVKAWEDNGSSYVTHFNFYVYPKTFTIKFLDTVKDTAISLKQWRLQSKQQKSN